MLPFNLLSRSESAPNLPGAAGVRPVQPTPPACPGRGRVSSMSALPRAPLDALHGLPGAQTQTPSAPRVAQHKAAAEGERPSLARVPHIRRLEPSFVRMISDRLRACCCQKRPLLTPMKRKDYEALRDQVGTLMDSALSVEEICEVLEFRDDESEGGSLIEFALRNNNPAAAAAIVLGILDSGIPLLEKARLLRDDRLDSKVRKKLGKVRPVEDPQEWAASLRTLIQAGRDPVLHAVSMLEHRVQPRNAPAEVLEACYSAHLRCRGNRTGERMLCTAHRRIEVLERMYGSYVSTSRHHVYAIPASRLEAVVPAGREPTRRSEAATHGSSCETVRED